MLILVQLPSFLESIPLGIKDELFLLCSVGCEVTVEAYMRTTDSSSGKAEAAGKWVGGVLLLTLAHGV